MNGRGKVLGAVLVLLASAMGLFLALAALLAEPASPAAPLVIAETDDYPEDLVVVGQGVEIIGHAAGSVLVLGGDVKITGTVDGDVAAVGGSVTQTDGSHITGDVLVIGGQYAHRGCQSHRVEGKQTVIFQGNQESLRNFFNNPAQELLLPKMDRFFVGRRLAAALFSFLLTLAIVAAAPGPVGRASERLATSALNVAVIGLIGTVAVLLLAGIVLAVLPAPAAAFMLLVVLFALLFVQVYGRVVTYFLVGRWLQRRLFGERSRSQTTALVLGVLVLAFLGSLPIVGALLLLAIFILSMGVVLTSPGLVRLRG